MIEIELLRKIIIEGFATGFVLVWCVVAHEWGHLVQIKKLYPEATAQWEQRSITIGTDEMWRHMTKQQKDDVLLSGYLTGFIPLFFLAIIIPNLILVFGAYTVYLLGSWNDIKMMSIKE